MIFFILSSNFSCLTLRALARKSKSLISFCENKSEISGKSIFNKRIKLSFIRSESLRYLLNLAIFLASKLVDLISLLKSSSFARNHSIDKNIALIKHLKSLSDKDSVNGVTGEILSNWPFIIDHKNKLNIPSEIYFPTANDKNWNNSESALAFLHIEIQEWLSLNLDMRIWVEQLGVVEKTDISFITKTLIPNSESWFAPSFLDTL